MEHLPARVRSALHTTLAKGMASPATISCLLSETVTEVDRAITRDFQRLFPSGREELARLGDQQIAVAMRSRNGAYSKNILRCMEGSTALFTLTDPSGTHLWVTNLGDCRAGKIFATMFLARYWQSGSKQMTDSF